MTTSSPWDAGFDPGFGHGAPVSTPVAGWPTVTDVENWLRTVGQPAAEATVTAQALAAAIDWVTMRADPDDAHVPPSDRAVDRVPAPVAAAGVQ